MKLTQTFQALITPFLAKQQLGAEFLKKSLLTVCFLTLTGFAVWFLGPYFNLNGITLLDTPERRIYSIVFLFLVWLLKFLMLDLDSANVHKMDSKAQKKIQELQKRFYGALRFLKKTTVTRQNKSIHLNQLSWFLMLGPLNAGKTTLLAHSGVNFILQRQFVNHNREQIEASENCDWWITNHACLIDIPSQYLYENLRTRETNQASTSYLWQNLLQLIKKNRGKNALSGIIIALPLPEMIRQGDPKKYTRTLHHLFAQLYEIQKYFPRLIPCQLIITKCDLLPGFSEFFSESSNDEIGQSFGVHLYDLKQNAKLHEAFSIRFNALIKKLNQQLLWRLHQERNPLARPYIKDFPLQIERTKEFISDFIKKFAAARFNLQLQGIYLTSALQSKIESSHIVEETLNSKERAVALFKEPLPTSRAYFIKHLLTQDFAKSYKEEEPAQEVDVWSKRFSYVASIAAILAASVWLVKDFKQGIQKTTAIQNEIAEFQLVSQQFHNSQELLESTLRMLNTLKQSTKKPEFKLDFAHLFAFYSQKSQQNAALAYQQALQAVLLPVIKTYFEEYLKNPVNKTNESVYGVLKAYVMLGDKDHFQPGYIITSLKQILPKSIEQKGITELDDHLSLALNLYWKPLLLNANSLAETRRFLTSIPTVKLSYIILKNIDDNNNQIEINFGLNNNTITVFTSNQFSSFLPNMFTGRLFPSIFSQQTMIAAEEAVNGNWILGNTHTFNNTPEFVNTLIQQLRSTYINNYIEKWETLVGNIRIAPPNNLKETDKILVNLLSIDSPLLQLLQTLRENTYFEPIVSSSPKLQNLTALINKSNSPEELLYQIFASLQNLHEYLQTILNAENERKAAFNASIRIMQHNSTPDPITQLRGIATTSPEPLKNWLNTIANHTWFFLMQEANRYLDVSWQEKVVSVYLTEIANRYPFSSGTRIEVDLQKFTHFFGNPGTMTSFYREYLEPFIDTSTPDWHWKTVDNYKLPFSQEKLRQIQHAMRIHTTFFPNNDNKLNLHFTLQPYQFGKNIKKVKLNVANSEFVDLTSLKTKTPHAIQWPSSEPSKISSVQLLMMNNQVIQHKYIGEWGWFKLINQSYESAITKKEILLNFSFNQHAAKYLLFTNEKVNPFLSLNLHHFHLPEQLLDQNA